MEYKIKKITIDKFSWGIIPFTFIILGILDILGIDSYGYHGTIKANFQRGLWTIPISIIVLIIIIKFFKNKETKVYICPECEEVYSEIDYIQNNNCNICDIKLVDVKKYYDK